MMNTVTMAMAMKNRANTPLNGSSSTVLPSVGEEDVVAVFLAMLSREMQQIKNEAVASTSRGVPSADVRWTAQLISQSQQITGVHVVAGGGRNVFRMG